MCGCSSSFNGEIEEIDIESLNFNGDAESLDQVVYLNAGGGNRADKKDCKQIFIDRGYPHSLSKPVAEKACQLLKNVANLSVNWSNAPSKQKDFKNWLKDTYGWRSKDAEDAWDIVKRGYAVPTNADRALMSGNYIAGEVDYDTDSDDGGDGSRSGEPDNPLGIDNKTLLIYGGAVVGSLVLVLVIRKLLK